MKHKFLFVLFALLTTRAIAADNGIISVESSRDVAETTMRLERILRDEGMTIFARVNHGKGAEKAGEELRPTELLIFGNPKPGSVLMQCNPVAGIDLPQKALIWEDSRGKTWISYNDPVWLAKRHNLIGCGSVVSKIKKALDNFATEAAR